MPTVVNWLLKSLFWQQEAWTRGSEMRSSSRITVGERNMFGWSHMTSAGWVPPSSDRSDWSSLEGPSGNTIPANIQLSLNNTQLCVCSKHKFFWLMSEGWPGFIPVQRVTLPHPVRYCNDFCSVPQGDRESQRKMKTKKKKNCLSRFIYFSVLFKVS